VRVSEDDIAEAIRIYTPRRITWPRVQGRAACGSAEGKSRYAGKRVGLILSGGNIDMPVLAQILRGETPAA